MKRFLWLGLILLSVSWLFFIPIFNTPDWAIGMIFLIIGIVFNILGFWKHDFKEINRKYILILIPLFLAIIVIPLPYSLGLIVLTIGIILYIIKSLCFASEKANWFFLGVSFSGLILSLQMLLFPLYSIIVSHGHRVDFLSSIVSFFSNLFGLTTSVNEGIVFVQTYEQTYPFTTTLEKLGFFPWFNILIGALLIFFLLPKIRKVGIYIIGFLVVSGVYLIFRYVFFIFIFTRTVDINVLWDPVLISISFIPLALLFMKFISLNNVNLDLDYFKKFNVNKKHVLAIIMVFLFVFSLVGAFVFQDPGTEKNGRILIDEVHSDWESTTRKIDKEWYGMLSTYNYYSLSEWLDKYYSVDKNTDKTLTLDLLKNYDILILKCPTNLYSNAEVDDIVQFVNEGGGLYLIGDHTNVFGMNYYLNQVSENFGITFKTDATYELGTGMTSIYKPDAIFPHPIVQNMDEFNFLTSCTLSAPITSENVIIGNRLIGEPGTYSTENFFRESISAPDMEYGLLLQVVAVKYGGGRVVAFTDSTCFSNFCMFMDGYRSFNLGTVEYLNRVNTYAYLNTFFAVVALASITVSLILLRKERKAMIIYLFLVVGLLSFSIATPTFSYINSVNYSVPSPHSDYIEVCFDEQHSDFVISPSPSISLYYSTEDAYTTFYVWTQRVDCIASLEKKLDDAITKGCDIIVIINPIETFDTEEINSLKSYVEQGGNLLVMDGIRNSDSTANALLQNFNMGLKVDTYNYPVYNLNTTVSNLSIGNITAPYLSIIGGENVFATNNNETLIAVTELGQGKVVVVVDSYTFSDAVMGGTFTEPDDSLMEIYNTMFYLFEEILLEDI